MESTRKKLYVMFLIKSIAQRPTKSFSLIEKEKVYNTQTTNVNQGAIFIHCNVALSAIIHVDEVEQIIDLQQLYSKPKNEMTNKLSHLSMLLVVVFSLKQQCVFSTDFPTNDRTLCRNHHQLSNEVAHIVYNNQRLELP